MGNADFSALCKEIVAKYTNEHLDKSDGKQIGTEDVFIVWLNKTLQNNTIYGKKIGHNANKCINACTKHVQIKKV